MYEIVLIRHGQTVFNADDRIQGSSDSPLTKKAEQEARQLGQALANCEVTVDRWFVSPQGRARATSDLIRSTYASDLPAEEVYDNLREIHAGDFEGQRHSEVDQGKLQEIRRKAAVPYPGGESVLDVVTRAEDFLDHWKGTVPRIVDHHRTIVISHGNTIRCLASVLAGAGDVIAMRAIIHNLSISRFMSRSNDFYFRIVEWNARQYLHGGNPVPPIDH